MSRMTTLQSKLENRYFDVKRALHQQINQKAHVRVKELGAQQYDEHARTLKIDNIMQAELEKKMAGQINMTPLSHLRFEDIREGSLETSEKLSRSKEDGLGSGDAARKKKQKLGNQKSQRMLLETPSGVKIKVFKGASNQRNRNQGVRDVRSGRYAQGYASQNFSPKRADAIMQTSLIIQSLSGEGSSYLDSAESPRAIKEKTMHNLDLIMHMQDSPDF